jgi:methionine biosynthesis protein MetW
MVESRKEEAKRRTDQMVINQGIQSGDKVLDLGCGRGSLLQLLIQEKQVRALGVDINPSKILECVKKGIPVYQGDVDEFLGNFPDQSFDRVILSRTVEHLQEPGRTIGEALRVGRRVTVGFINHGFWVNRMNYFIKGSRTINDVYPKPWYESAPVTFFSLANFEDFCRKKSIRIHDRVCLDANWKNECRILPNLLAGYVICDISK